MSEVSLSENQLVYSHPPDEARPWAASPELFALGGWTVEVLYCDPKGRMEFM